LAQKKNSIRMAAMGRFFMTRSPFFYKWPRQF
jgi:hypothetical protein